MPYAALNRPAFGALRRGDFGSVQVRIIEAWDLRPRAADLRPHRNSAQPRPVCCLVGESPPARCRPSVERFSWHPSTTRRSRGPGGRRVAAAARALAGSYDARGRVALSGALVSREPRSCRAVFSEWAGSRVGSATIRPRLACAGRWGRSIRHPGEMSRPPRGRSRPSSCERSCLAGEHCAFPAVDIGIGCDAGGGRSAVGRPARRECRTPAPHPTWLRDVEAKWIYALFQRLRRCPTDDARRCGWITCAACRRQLARPEGGLHQGGHSPERRRSDGTASSATPLVKYLKGRQLDPPRRVQHG